MCLKCSQVGHFARVCRFNGEDDTLTPNDGNKTFVNSSRSSKKAKRSFNDSKENRNDVNVGRPKGEANNNKQGFKDKQREKQSGASEKDE